MLSITRLIWDEGTVAHIARHAVTPDEVEQVCRGEHLVRQGHSGRLLVIGPTEAGRILAVVIDPEPTPGHYYPVTARPADRQERRRYAQEKGGEQAA
jgi:uncharacterized DUF497 family protein